MLKLCVYCLRCVVADDADALARDRSTHQQQNGPEWSSIHISPALVRAKLTIDNANFINVSVLWNTQKRVWTEEDTHTLEQCIEWAIESKDRTNNTSKGSK